MIASDVNYYYWAYNRALRAVTCNSPSRNHYTRGSTHRGMEGLTYKAAECKWQNRHNRTMVAKGTFVREGIENRHRNECKQ